MSAVTLDAREFIIKPTNPWTEGINTQVPGVYVYLLNLLVKLSIKTMPTSASNKAYNAVDPIGIIACWAFSLSNFHIQGNSFVDILLAKYHFVCPPLFGIYGSEKTQQGRTRLGVGSRIWRRGLAISPSALRQAGWCQCRLGCSDSARLFKVSKSKPASSMVLLAFFGIHFECATSANHVFARDHPQGLDRTVREIVL